nr:fibronectin type III domain-containing protein [Verrucomicrobiota bacterium]
MKRKLIKSKQFAAFTGAAITVLLLAADVIAAKGPQPSICSRSCWGAKSSNSASQMSGLTRAIIHHTAGSEYNTTGLESSKSYQRSIQNLHQNVNGWGDIGYHFTVDKFGNTFEGRLGSMSSLPRGAHDANNFNSFGFTAMGYFHSPRNNALTSAQKNALEAVIAWRMPSAWSANGSGTYNGNTVGYLDGHYKVKATACPGTIIINQLGSIRTGVMNKKNGTSSTPSAPSGLTATAATTTQINLAWTDNSGIETGFKIERSLSSGSGFSQIATVGANVKTYSSTGLAAGTRYYYRVRAYNAAGNSSYSNTANTTTKQTIPTAPSGLTATTASDVQINLSWADNSGNEDGFRIFRSTDNSTYTQIASVGVNVKTYNNTGLAGNRLYYYRVASYNSAGNSGNSNTASTTTAPHAPSNLTVNIVSGTTNWNKLQLAWTDNSSAETGFKIERGTAAAGPFTQIATTAAGVASYQNTGLSATTTYYYRVRSYNANGNSTYTPVVSRATPNAPPVLGAIGNKTVAAGSSLAFTATATDPNATTTTTTWQNFTSFGHNTPNETVLFRRPSNSATTSAFLTTATNYTRVVSNGPTAWGAGNKSILAGWTFKTGVANYWIRLNTFNTATNPNPTIALDQRVQFKVYANKAVKIGLGVRETGTTAAYGANGGTTGAIEWVGVTNVVSGAPIPNKLVAATTATTLNFNIPFEPQAGFTGDGVVPQTSVKGVLEHVIIKGEGGTGAYTVWFDDFQVVVSNKKFFTLVGAPSGASIGYRNGKFSWTPTTGQVGAHTFTVRVTDELGALDSETITVTVTGTGNAAPVLATIGNKTVNELSNLSFTATATDANAGQTLTFSLLSGAPAGASISTSGAFSWTPTEAQGPGSYPITVRVTDNGSPSSNAQQTITVTVNEVNAAPVLAVIANQTINELTALNVTAVATDSDIPANTITYSLLNAPSGMTINPSSGAISWTPTELQGPDVVQVTVRAADNGVPSLNASRTFNVTVNEVNVAPVLTTPTTSTKVNTIARFDDTDDEPNGVVLFRHPLYSSTSSAFLDATPNSSVLVTSPNFPLPDDNTSHKALRTTFSFKTGTVNPWLRLTTYTLNTNHAFVPNPTISLNSKLRFKVYTDKSIKLALAVRETGINAPIGFNGGVAGPVEYVGVSGKQANGCPIPTRTIAAGSWTTLEFNLPSEPCASFVSGDGILASGKGTIEQIAIVPNGGMGAYNVYFDDFEVVETSSTFVVDTGAAITFQCTATDADRLAGGALQDLSFSLNAGAPTNAEIDAITGVFTWTPTPEQSPSTNVVSIRVTDNGSPALSNSKNVTIIVNKVNTAPYFGNMPDEEIYLGNGEVLSWDVDAGDDDNPGDILSFSLIVKPTGATINSSGVISWTAPSSGSSTNTFTVRVQDNGSPVLFTDESFKVIVTPANTAPVLNLGSARITEAVVNYESFTNGTPNEQVMFRKPSFSSTTTNFLDMGVTNYTTVTTSFPAGNANAGSKVLRAEWSFKTGTSNYWLRLTTTDTAFLPNTTINASARLKFDIYTTKTLKVGVGIRETGTSAENGANGGISGAIEYVGVGSKVGTTPVPTRTVSAGTWTTLEFDLPNEPCQTLTGNSVLAAGQQVLEHLILKGEGGTGVYTVYVDNFQVVGVIPTLNSDEDTGLVEFTMKTGSTLTFTASATDTDAVTFSL